MKDINPIQLRNVLFNIVMSLRIHNLTGEKWTKEMMKDIDDIFLAIDKPIEYLQGQDK